MNANLYLCFFKNMTQELLLPKKPLHEFKFLVGALFIHLNIMNIFDVANRFATSKHLA